MPRPKKEEIVIQEKQSKFQLYDPIENIPELSPYVEQLKAKGIKTLAEAIVYLHFAGEKESKLALELLEKYAGFMTADQLTFEFPVLPSNIKSLDNALGGGFKFGALYVIHGPPNSGKTQLLMWLAAQALMNGYRVAIIDGERSIRVDRIAKFGSAKNMSNLKMAYALNADHAAVLTKHLTSLAVDVVLADGLLYLLKREFPGRENLAERQQALKAVMRPLISLTFAGKLVVLTNQVIEKPVPFHNQLIEIGGPTFLHMPNYDLSQKGRKEEGGLIVQGEVFKAPDLPNNEYIFKVASDAILSL
ncbi:MAG: hypothetical protein JZD41_02610 [Thermoproteus sp.]|nr:hypothetical protein [Thermoproteus sp.]